MWLDLAVFVFGVVLALDHETEGVPTLGVVLLIAMRLVEKIAGEQMFYPLEFLVGLLLGLFFWSCRWLFLKIESAINTMAKKLPEVSD